MNVLARHRRVALIALLALLAGGCATEDSGVAAREYVSLPQPFERGVALDPVEALPAIDAIDWASCDDHDGPWECGSIEVPIDYRRPTVSGTVTIAVTRLPASDGQDRIGSLVLNPGGPGASGIDLAWGFGSLFPASLLARFDLVGFDPRGVGRSTAVDCGDVSRSFEVDVEKCVERSSALLPYVGTPNSARDLEQLRKALGDDRLSYLGFSYGTALGAVYADLFPDSVRALVLDGAVDPEAGRFNVDGTAAGTWGTPYYGVQDFYGTAHVFYELCDSTTACKAGPDSRAMVNNLVGTISDVPTSYFDQWDEHLTARQVQGLILSSMYSIDLWGPLAVGIADAAEGDASTLAALGSFLEAGYPRVEDGYDNMSAANFAIYCADFAGRSGDLAVAGCHGLPETAEPLPPIAKVELDTPALVIGTDGDPATPGFLAPRMADALGSAVSVRWEGAGHTAFLQSGCVDAIVIDYLIDLAVPENHTHCGFTDDVDTTVARAEQVFKVDKTYFDMRLTDVFTQEGLDADVAACVAEGIVANGSPSMVVYARLGVQRPEYVRKREQLERECTPN